jgi:YHS domain-containing protein
MKKSILCFVACVAALAVTSSSVLAAPKPPKCPACHMALSMKKNKEHPVAVKIKGKTYYCCAGCDMKKKK